MLIRTRDIRRKASAMVLLAVFLSMLFAVSLHRHPETADAASEETCADCEHHVRHAGHLSATTVHLHHCVLCQLQSTPYVPGQTALWKAFVPSFRMVYLPYSSFITGSTHHAYATRAPPYIV